MKVRPGQRFSWKNLVKFEVVSVSKQGEVRLRPVDPEQAAKEFPPEEWTRGRVLRCPFKRDNGDFLCHEAWSVWEDMHLL
jgi:hypothetical protein